MIYGKEGPVFMEREFAEVKLRSEKADTCFCVQLQFGFTLAIPFKDKPPFNIVTKLTQCLG